jgi:hypothetical protein
LRLNMPGIQTAVLQHEGRFRIRVALGDGLGPQALALAEIGQR